MGGQTTVSYITKNFHRYTDQSEAKWQLFYSGGNKLYQLYSATYSPKNEPNVMCQYGSNGDSAAISSTTLQANLQPTSSWSSGTGVNKGNPMCWSSTASNCPFKLKN